MVNILSRGNAFERNNVQKKFEYLFHSMNKRNLINLFNKVKTTHNI